MKRFSTLFTRLDQTTKTNEKMQALEDFFAASSGQDTLWAIALLSHRRPRRAVSVSLLREWAAAHSGLPLWLFEESYHIVGDLAETIALVLPTPAGETDKSLTAWLEFIQSLELLDAEQKKAHIVWAWDHLDRQERFVFNKLITGAFRVGVSQQLMVKALARHTRIEASLLAHRLMGNWSPVTTSLRELVHADQVVIDRSKPYPFYLAYALESNPESLGDPAAWLAERKWDGIRGQVVVRNGELYVWSRGEELVTDKYPEYQVLKNLLPDGTVLDGEILPVLRGRPLPFAKLQTRIGRKRLNQKLLKDVPIAFMAYDLLEWQFKDIRKEPLHARRAMLESLIEQLGSDVLLLSPRVEFAAWPELQAARARSRDFESEGIMLKRKDSSYRDGRRRGDWWKWKLDPYTVDAVMVYAQAGHGRRANLYTDFTFAIRDGNDLVPFTKAYSGLTDAEFSEITRWVQRHTLERFGPVRKVPAELVFEIGFEGIQESPRHKSGIALRFPRMLRRRHDKGVAEIDTIETLRGLLGQQKPG
ncbi:MAG: ATP-dependent DNA ligase [Tabrizicola sp.]|nr:ATP-dependent DNA ligase [Tabrizicola sp.]